MLSVFSVAPQRVTLIAPLYSILSMTERVATQAFYEDLLGNLQQITAVEQLATFIKITWTRNSMSDTFVSTSKENINLNM